MDSRYYVGEDYYEYRAQTARKKIEQKEFAPVSELGSTDKEIDEIESLLDSEFEE